MAIDRVNEFLGPTHPTLQNLDFDSARVTLELGESVERMFANIPRGNKKRISRDDDASRRHEASIEQQLKKRRTS